MCRTLGITPPAANLRSLVIRFASEFITQRYTSNSSNTGNTGNTATVGTAGGPLAAATGAGGPAGGHDDGGGGPLIASRNRHPLMKCAVQLAELLMRAGIGEGRQNNTLAGMAVWRVWRVWGFTL